MNKNRIMGGAIATVLAVASCYEGFERLEQMYEKNISTDTSDVLEARNKLIASTSLSLDDLTSQDFNENSLTKNQYELFKAAKINDEAWNSRYEFANETKSQGKVIIGGLLGTVGLLGAYYLITGFYRREEE